MTATTTAIVSTTARRITARGRWTARQTAKMPVKTTPTNPFVRIDSPSATPAMTPQVSIFRLKAEATEVVVEATGVLVAETTGAVAAGAGGDAARTRHSAATHMNGTRPT